MRLAVIGGRDFKDKELLYNTLDSLKIKPSKIVSGGAVGADSLAESWANDNNIETQIFYPDWETHGRAAGPIRNRLIISNCDVCIAFWDGKSKGTKSSIDMCTASGVKFYIINY